MKCKYDISKTQNCTEYTKYNTMDTVLCFKYKAKNKMDYNAYNTLHEIPGKTKMYRI